CGLQHQSAVRAGADYRLFGHCLAGSGAGTRDRHSVAERSVDQRRGAEQVRIAVLLDRPAWEPRDDRADRDHPLGDTGEADRRLARRQSYGARFGDHREAARPFAVHRIVGTAIGIAVERNRQRGWRRGFDRPPRLHRGRREPRQERDEQSGAAHASAPQYRVSYVTRTSRLPLAGTVTTYLRRSALICCPGTSSLVTRKSRPHQPRSSPAWTSSTSTGSGLALVKV